MKTKIRLLIGFSFLTLSSCSPFGNQSIVEEISNSIAKYTTGKTATNLTSSAEKNYASPNKCSNVTSASGTTSICYSDGLTGGDAPVAYYTTQSVGEVYSGDATTTGNSISGFDSAPIPSVRKNITTGGYQVQNSITIE